MPAKHQPDLIYLRYVPLWKVHVFTVVQLSCLIVLWSIKASSAAVVFPMMVRRPRRHDLITTPAAVCVQSPEAVTHSLASSRRPLQVLALVFIRKLLDFCFTKRELSWLDDLIPESKKKKDDDKKKKEKEVRR